MPIPIEEISDGEKVSRNAYYPLMYGDAGELIWESVFQFPGRPCESLVWRKYALSDAAVHDIGWEHERNKRKSKPLWRYTGFFSAVVGTVRKIKTCSGHGFSIVHNPVCESPHHTDICYSPANGADPTTLRKTEKLDLKATLKKAFNQFVGYAT